MATANMAMPPIPPSVLAQQMPPARPPVMEFAQGAPAAPEPQFDSAQFMASKMNQVAELLTEVAKVLVIENPALVPLVKQMAKVGSALQNELQASLPQGGAGANPNQPPTQLQKPESENAAGMVSMA